MKKARIHIFYKDAVFDPQGNAIATSLQQMGFDSVSDVRMGKVIDVEFKDQTEDIEGQLQRMCQDLLANPVIESFKYECLDAGA